MKKDRILLIKDGTQIINSFDDEAAAYRKLLDIQPHSTHYATKHGGYEIIGREMFTISKVELTRAEGRTDIEPENCAGRKETVNSITEANQVLKRWQATAKSDKIDFTVYFGGAEHTYSGCYLLTKDKSPDLLGHVKSFLECYGGIKKPAHLTAKQWQGFTELERKAGRQSEAIEFYNNYDIHTK